MRYLRKPISLFLLILYLPACMSYKTTTLAPQEVVANHDRIRVEVRENGDTYHVELTRPWATADSVGGIEECFAPWDAYQVRAFPTEKVEAVQTPRFDVGRSISLALGLWLVGGMIAAAVMPNPFDSWGR